MNDNLSDIVKNFKVKDFLVDNLYYIAGCFLYALGVNMFAIPNKIAQSGITGVAIIINYIFPQFPVGLTGFILNIPLFILAWFFIGKRFTVKTLWVTALISAIIDIVASLIGKGIILPYKGDIILSALFCGVMCGAGLALVIVRGATTGGTDVIGRLIKKSKPHISIGRIIMLCDAIVVISAAIVFKSVDSAMYAAILIFVSSVVMDKILYGTGNGKMLYIFTKNGAVIAKSITERCRRGTTVFSGTGGYTGERSELVICVAKSYEVHKIRKWVKEIDPQSFVVLSEANEILGKGFTPPAIND